MAMQEELEKFFFLPELQVSAENDGRDIGLSINTIPTSIKTELVHSFSAKHVIIKGVPKRKNRFLIIGGNPASKIEYLVALLTKLGKFFPERTLPYSRRVLSLISDKVTDETTESDLADIKELHIDELNAYNTGVKITENQLSKCPMEISPKMMIYLSSVFENPRSNVVRKLVRGLGIDSEEDFADMHCIQLQIPKTVLIGVKRNPDKMFTLTFTDHGPLKAESIRDIISSAIDKASKTQCLKWKFTYCDEITLKTLQEAQSTIGAPILCVPSIESEGEDYEDFDLYVLSSSCTELIQQTVEKLYQSHYLAYCKKCGLMYSPISDAQAVCEIYSHSGRRIPFPNSSDMEQEMYDEETGEPITYVRYSCCGEVEIDEPGCVKKSAGSHEVDEAKKNISSLKYEGELAFGK